DPRLPPREPARRGRLRRPLLQPRPRLRRSGPAPDRLREVEGDDDGYRRPPPLRPHLDRELSRSRDFKRRSPLRGAGFLNSSSLHQTAAHQAIPREGSRTPPRPTQRRDAEPHEPLLRPPSTGTRHGTTPP